MRKTICRGFAGRAAASQVWSHQFGVELRLLVSGDDLPRTQVVCSHEELIRAEELTSGARGEGLDQVTPRHATPWHATARWL
jgi:hypothetical protein